LTIGQKYSYAIGSTVILPCKINETGTCFCPFSAFKLRFSFCLKKNFHSWAKWLIISADKNTEYVLAWKRGNAVLTAGHVKVTMNPRIRLIPVHELPEVSGTSAKTPTGYNLELRDVRVTDAGEYGCQIGTLEPQEIVHKLEVLVPPKIDFISPGGGRLDVAKGSAIRLECRGSGNPTPKIYWSRKVLIATKQLCVSVLCHWEGQK
jgi:hypothetical protein